jgi:uncharacterized protein
MHSMKHNRLPVLVEPKIAGSRREMMTGKIVANHLKRLHQEANQTLSEVTCKVEFNVDLQQITYFKGQANAELDLVCQRCMQTYRERLSVSFCYTPIEQACKIEELPEVYDVVEMNSNGQINLHQLVEDELITSIPLIPAHQNEQCHQGTNDVSVGDIDESETEQRQSPFDILASLKNNE